MLRPSLLSLCVLFSACTGGSVNVALTLPRPGGIFTLPNGNTEMRAGIVVSTSDGVAVCERIRIRVYTAATKPANLEKPPADAKPVAEGRALGTYTEEKPSCSALIVNLPPRGDYWVVLEYPRSPSFGDPYYTFGRPSLTQPPPMVLGFYPVKVVDKQTTQLSATMIGPGYQPPSLPPGA